MDKIRTALDTIDELIIIRKAALEKAMAKSAKVSSDEPKGDLVAKHKSALKTLRRARRMLVACLKKERENNP